MEVQTAIRDAEILKCREVMLALRPHIQEDNFLPLVKNMTNEGYQLAFIEEDGKAVAAIGYRYLQFLFNGKHFYIEDLSTLQAYRGKGYAGMLLDFVANRAKELGYKEITLDSDTFRADAHRLYLNKKFTITDFHFAKKIN